MYRQIIIPESSSILLNLPANFIGKQVEVIAFEIEEPFTKKEQKKKSDRQELEEYFSKFRFDVKNLKLSRDEANER